MDVSDREFQDLLARVRARTQEAERQLVDLFTPHVYKVVRRCWDHRLQGAYGEEDAVQEVWVRFLTRGLWRQTFATPEGLQGYLTTTARHVVYTIQRRHLLCRRHDHGRERSLEAWATGRGRNLEDGTADPVRAALARDEWNCLLAGLLPREQVIVVRAGEGYTQAEIAEEMHLDERTVRRVIGRLRGRGVADLSDWGRLLHGRVRAGPPFGGPWPGPAGRSAPER